MERTPSGRLDDLQRRLDDLETAGRISEEAAGVLTGFIEDLRFDFEPDQWYSDSSTVRMQSHTLDRDLERLDELISSLEAEVEIPTEARELYNQLCGRVLGQTGPYEIIFYEDPDQDLVGFETHFHEHGECLCVFLRFGLPDKCLEYPFAALLAHEASHLHPAFAGPRTALNMSKRHLYERMQEAEIACDIGGIALLGPAFSRAFATLETFIEDSTQPTDEKHPSLTARAVGMSDVALPLWTEVIQESIRDHLDPLRQREREIGEMDRRVLARLNRSEETIKGAAQNLKFDEDDVTTGDTEDNPAVMYIRRSLEEDE